MPDEPTLTAEVKAERVTDMELERMVNVRVSAFRELVAERDRLREDTDRWLAWSGGRYPDDSVGDVVFAYMDGTIILDDGVTTWNPLRALAYFVPRENEDG